jgi:hypothetical protein
MKVALLLSGQARHFFEGFNTVKKYILDVYDVDVYCQVWWDEEVKKYGYQGRRGNFKVQDNIPDLILENYKPKKFLIERSFKVYQNDKILDSEIFFEYPEYINKMWTNKENDLSHYLGLKNVANLLSWNNYDFIIKSRYDTRFFSFPNLNLLDNSKFYPAQDYCGSLQFDEKMFCDWAFIFSNDMKEFTQVFDKLHEEEIYEFGSHPEAIYAKYIDMLGFRDKIIKLSANEFGYHPFW